MSETKPKAKPEAVEPIKKPGKVNLDKFRSTRPASVAGVETLLTGLPIHSIAQAKDLVRLHPDEVAYWSDELCFVDVPIKGQKRDLLHLIAEDLAMRYLPSGRIQRFRLALASKPYDVFFLAIVPTKHPDNSWNLSNQQACEQAKDKWVIATSRKAEGVESYRVTYAKNEDAFPEPKWPTQTFDEIIAAAFFNRMIDSEDHPALRRLLGAKQSVE